MPSNLSRRALLRAGVAVSPGTWATGPNYLKSHVALHGNEGATLLFPPDPRGTAVVTLQVQGYDNRADVRA